MPCPPEFADLACVDPRQWIAIVGDSQRTLLLERLLFWREQNDDERALIVRSILEASPGLVAFIGDLVATPSHWEQFDSMMRVVHEAGFPVLAAVGNHEYYSLSGFFGGLSGMEKRFPQLKIKRWYSRQYGRLGLIWLDTNKNRLSGAFSEQERWFAVELAAFDSNPEIDMVLVFGHHPPFSNTTVLSTGDHPPLAESILPSFLKSLKAQVFFSGHAHGYQRFQSGGKQFVVTAGGGGPRFPIPPPHRRRHQDLFDGPRLRPFNFVLTRLGAAGLELVTMGFEKGEQRARVLETLELPMPYRMMGP